MAGPDDRSYRALLAVPGLARVLTAMLVARVAAAMLAVTLVLFALDEYDSPAIAGAAAALSLFPGLVAAPVVGALLDRLGRLRLIRVDYAATAAALLAISAFALADALAAGVFLAIVVVFGLTQMFSDVGLRSLFPSLVPNHLWERLNAADSNGYLVAWILGPPLAATLTATLGGEAAFLVVAALFVVALVALRGVGEPPSEPDSGAGLWRQAAEGLRYVWHNATLRGMGVSVATTNISWGIALVLVPVIIVDGLGAPTPLVGVAFTLSGVVGVASAFAFGRLDTRGRELTLLVLAPAVIAVAALLLLPPASSTTMAVGVVWVLVSMAVLGFASGMWDIGIFTIRQRRTEPRLMSRAFAISMGFNQTGVPIGSALAGFLAEQSLTAAATVSVVAAALGSVLAAALVPRKDPADVDGGRPVSA